MNIQKQDLPKAPAFNFYQKRGATHNSKVRIGSVKIGEGRPFAIIAGPCSVENQNQILEIAALLKKTGVKLMRGGVFKPRTSPYSFRGLGEEALVYLSEAKKQTGVRIVSEVMEISQIQIMQDFVDMFQVGARNMQNFDLLQALGKTRKPVLLKRSPAGTIDEFLNAAEWILNGGNTEVILCLRGLVSYDKAYSRNLADIGDIPVLRELTHLPIIFDPSHAAGRADLVPALSKAALAAGAHGLIIEVHPNPQAALSDGKQSLTPEAFSQLVIELQKTEESLKIASKKNCQTELQTTGKRTALSWSTD